jgi:hypothetical protein
MAADGGSTGGGAGWGDGERDRHASGGRGDPPGLSADAMVDPPGDS